MCLDILDKEIDRRHLRCEGRYVVCWKIMRKVRNRRQWSGEIQSTRHKPGWNISKRRGFIRIRNGIYGFGEQYIPHYHAFMTKSDAQCCVRTCYCHVRDRFHIVKCKTFLKYITATGSQDGNVLVTKKIWIPPYPNKE